MDKNIGTSRLGLHGMRFKTWLYFFLMTIGIMALLIIMQISFFSLYYKNAKRKELRTVGASIIDEYYKMTDTREFYRYVYQTSFASGMTVSFFNVEYKVEGDAVTVYNETFKNILTSAQYGPEASSTVAQEGIVAVVGEEYFRKLDGGEPFDYVLSTGQNQSYAVYGAKIRGTQYGDVCMYVSTPLRLSSTMRTTQRWQALLSWLLCLVLSIILSWIISDRIARPVRDFSLAARRLAKGDYDVKFESNGLVEIQDLAETLNYATEEMGKTEQLRRDLLANVSHDLRTPLTMVKAYAEMIRDISGGDEKKRLSHSQTIIDEADRLTSLVDDIQNLSKLQARTEPLKKDDVDLASLAGIVLERFDIYSSKEGYVFIKEIDENCPPVVADAAKIEQVLYNLIGNAVNYTGDDKTVTVYVKNREKEVYFGVRDTGKGIAEEEIDSVWERYYRASQSKRKSVGTGLGLSIVKNILVLHGAEYGVSSTIGEGSLFWFTLPKKGAETAKEIKEEEKGRKKR